MKVRIKSFNAELPSYLTVGKEYDVFCDNIHGIYFNELVADDGSIKCINIDNCEYLSGGSWEVVYEW